MNQYASGLMLIGKLETMENYKVKNKLSMILPPRNSPYINI